MHTSGPNSELLSRREESTNATRIGTGLRFRRLYHIAKTPHRKPRLIQFNEKSNLREMEIENANHRSISPPNIFPKPKKTLNPLSISLQHPFISDPKKTQNPDMKGSSDAFLHRTTTATSSELARLLRLGGNDDAARPAGGQGARDQPPAAFARRPAAVVLVVL